MTPDLSRVGAWYHSYIKLVPETDLNAAFANSDNNLTGFFNSIPVSKHDYRYAEGKWTIREMLQHIIDAERVFTYRALRFDENLYAANAKADTRSWGDLVEEFIHTRKSSEFFFRSLDEEQLEANGISSGSPIYVRALGYIVIGHPLHHRNILIERYL